MFFCHVSNMELWWILGFSYGFPMVSPWFSYGFPMVSLWFSYGFPMVFPTSSEMARPRGLYDAGSKGGDHCSGFHPAVPEFAGFISAIFVGIIRWISQNLAFRSWEFGVYIVIFAYIYIYYIGYSTICFQTRPILNGAGLEQQETGLELPDKLIWSCFHVLLRYRYTGLDTTCSGSWSFAQETFRTAFLRPDGMRILVWLSERWVILFNIQTCISKNIV